MVRSTNQSQEGAVMPRTILIIDDEPNMRWVLGRALEQVGHTVHGAISGDEASSLLGREQIDLVLLSAAMRRPACLGVSRSTWYSSI
jgi:DNA-binding NtrC family response regulator